MLSYVLVMNLLRSFVFTGRGWELVARFPPARYPSYLVRPVSYHGYCLALDLAQKTVHLAAAFIEVESSPFWFRRPSTSRQTGNLDSVRGGRSLSSLIFSSLEFIVASMAFWTSESGGPRFASSSFSSFLRRDFFPFGHPSPRPRSGPCS